MSMNYYSLLKLGGEFLVELRNRMCISQNLNNHPVLKESFKYRMNYINALQYFYEKYAIDNIYALAVLENYKKTFLGQSYRRYEYRANRIGSAMRYIKKVQVREFQVYSNCFYWIIDCLFCCAFDDENKGRAILNEIKNFFGRYYYKSIDLLYRALYQSDFSSKEQNTEFMISWWAQNRNYCNRPTKRILITANMSAGKSMLINALVGKKVTKTKNDTCTSKIYYIQSKAFEDGIDCLYDQMLDINVNQQILLDGRENSESDEIIISTYFRFMNGLHNKICFVDTPGVNSALNKEHRVLTEAVVAKKHYDMLIYVINGEYIGTEDDRRYMEYLAKVIGNRKVIFAVNKLDKFRLGDDNIAASLRRIRWDIKKIGFTNAEVCPVSAYTGFLAKKKLWNEFLNEDEQDDLEMLRRKFKKREYDLSQYYNLNHQESWKMLIETENDENRRRYLELLYHSGIWAFENTILN